MEALREHILGATEPIKARIVQFIDAQPGNGLKWKFCLVWPIEVAIELTCRIALLSPGGLSSDTVDRLIASISTRYIFDLLANVSVMLNTEPEQERDKLQDQWIKLRDMVIVADGTYRMPLDHLPPETSKRLQKKKEFESEKWPKYNQTEGKEKLVDSISVSNPAFLFEDPWGLSMAKKVALIPTSDPELFLDRWKMYSYVAHASAFSLWPTWMYPVPIHDAIQSLSLLLKVVGRFIDYEFDSKSFIEKAWLHIEEDQKRAGQA